MNEISLSCHNLLQPGQQPTAGLRYSLPGHGGKHLHDGGDEELLGVMKQPINISLSYAPHKIVYRIAVR